MKEKKLTLVLLGRNDSVENAIKQMDNGCEVYICDDIEEFLFTIKDLHELDYRVISYL